MFTPDAALEQSVLRAEVGSGTRMGQIWIT